MKTHLRCCAVLLLLCLYGSTFAQSGTKSAFRLRAESSAKAMLSVNDYAMPQQTGKKVMDNSYVYLDSYSVLAAQISTFDPTTTNGANEINTRVTKLIKIQDDMNRLYHPYDDMDSPWVNRNNMWYSGYMMTVLQFLKAHTAKMQPGTTLDLVKKYEDGVRKFISNMDFNISKRTPGWYTAFSNLNFPSLFTRYLAIEMWPSELDRENRPFHVFKGMTKGLILRLLSNRFHEGFIEEDATTYSSLQLEPLKMLAEYAQDPELKAKARATFQAYMVSLSHDYNNGLAVICPDRSKGLEMSPTGSNVARMAWLFLGAERNNFSEGQRRRVSGLLVLPGELEPDVMSQEIYKSREVYHNSNTFVPYESTESINDEVERKYISKNYTIATSTGTDGSVWANAESKNNMIGWQGIPGTDIGVNWLTFCIENDMNRRSKDGDNKYARQYHHKKTIVGVFNVPASEDHYKPFLPLNYTTDIQIRKYLYLQNDNWLFCHTGTMMYAVGIFGTTGKMPKLSTTVPKFFGGFSHYFILDEDKAGKGGWIIETAELSEDAYKGKSKAEQLAAFKEQILAKTNGQNRWSLGTDSPIMTFTNLAGEKMSIDYTKGRKLNDQVPTNLFPTDIYNSSYFHQKNGSDKIYVGTEENGTTIEWPSNSAPSTEYNYTDTYVLPAGQTSVTASTIEAYAFDPELASKGISDLKVGFKTKTGLSALSYTSPYTPYYVEPGKINSDTSIVFIWKDKAGRIASDTLLFFVVKPPQAMFNRNLRNQYLPSETPNFDLKGKDIAQKIMDLEVLYDATPTDDKKTLSRLAYYFPNTRPDSMACTEKQLKVKPFTHPASQYVLTGKVRAWKSSTIVSTDTMTIYVRNIVITSPTPNTELTKDNGFKSFTVTGAMALPTTYPGLNVTIKITINGNALPPTAASINGATFTADITLPATVKESDKVNLIATMSYTANNKTETFTSVAVPLQVKAVRPNAGADVNICAAPKSTTTTYQLKDFSPNYGSWTVTTQPTGSSASVNKTGMVSGLKTGGEYKLTYTANGFTDQMTLTVNAVPSAGPDLSSCTTTGSIALKGQPSNGTWSLLAKPEGTTATVSIDGVLSNLNKSGKYTLQYDVKGCKDDVVVTTAFNQVQLPTLAILNAPICQISGGKKRDIGFDNRGRLYSISVKNDSLKFVENNKWSSTFIKAKQWGNTTTPGLGWYLGYSNDKMLVYSYNTLTEKAIRTTAWASELIEDNNDNLWYLRATRPTIHRVYSKRVTGQPLPDESESIFGRAKKMVIGKDGTLAMIGSAVGEVSDSLQVWCPLSKSWTWTGKLAKDVSVGANGLVWFVGLDNKIYYWDKMKIQSVGNLQAVSLFAVSNTVAAIGTDGKAYSYTGSSWVVLNTPTKANITDVAIFSADKYALLDADGKVYSTDCAVVNKNARMSAEAQFTPSAEAEVESGISVYPNPASNELTVSCFVAADNTAVRVQMQDLLGKTVYEQDYKLSAGEHRLRINTSSLPSGSYLLNWVADQRKTTKKVMIVR